MSLLSPLYLLGLLAIALPFILHRFSHHEPPQQSFPSTRFLEPTKPPATSKRKLKYWLLFLVRSLFLLALCMLFTQPFWHQDEDAQRASRQTLLIVDTSFSMQSGERWANAQSAIAEALDEVADGSAVQLYSYGNQLTQLTELTSDKGLVGNAAASLSAGFGHADYGQLMRRLNKIAAEASRPVQAVFITDAQRSSLPERVNSLLANRLQSFDIKTVGGGTDTNYFLAAQALSKDSVHLRASVTVGASASNQQAQVTKNIVLTINGNEVASRAVSLTPGEVKSVDFDQIPLPVGEQLTLQVAFAQGDDMPADDTVRVPVQGLSPVTVAMAAIDSKPPEQAPVFISTALESNGAASVDDLSSSLDSEARHAIVFAEFSNTAELPASVLEYVQSGGNALVIQNARGTSASSDDNAGSGLALIDQAHPLALGQISWFDLRFHDTQFLNTQVEDTALLALDTGTPVLIERRTENSGSLLMLNDQLDGVVSDLPLQPAFVVLMNNIMRYFVASSTLPSQINAGQSLALAANMQVLSPDGNAMLGLSQTATSGSIRLTEPGVYSILDRDKVHALGVVLDPSESNLEAVQRSELDAWEARHNRADVEIENAAATNQTSSKPLPTDVFAENSSAYHQLWRWLIPLVLILLFAESVLANRMLWVRRDGL